MKRIFTLFLIVLSFEQTFCQIQEIRTVSGRLTASDGTPLPGVNITVKGTSTGTTTDTNGSYSIDAPVGSTLVFAFIGMQTREVVVTRDNLQSDRSTPTHKQKLKKKQKAIPFSILQDSLSPSTPGVATFTTDTPPYRNRSVDPSAIKSIRNIRGRVVIKTDSDPQIVNGFGLQFSTSFGLEEINRLPSLQSKFAQGRPIAGMSRWRGPDEGEIFSWGPSINLLEYDGSDYAYDQLGKLVQKGNGKGHAANHYDPLSFFKRGLSTSNELVVALPTRKIGKLTFSVEKTDRSGIIPNSRYSRLNFSGKLKSFQLFEDVTAAASVSYNRSTGDLLMRGANYASIVGSIFRTPPTFDNANGLSPQRARHMAEAFYLENGTVRSHAPGLADNPYGLACELPDREKMERIMGATNLSYSPSNRFSMIVNGSIDRQSANNINGIPFGQSGYPTGRLSNRSEQDLQANASLSPTFTFPYVDGTIKASLSWLTQFESRQLKRLDGFTFEHQEATHDIFASDSLVALRKNSSRMSHEIAMSAIFESNDWLTIRVGNRYYLSNTINASSYTNLFPSASFSIDLVDLIALWPIDMLKIYGAISRSVKEAPLIYNDWAYNSTRLPAQAYNRYYENSELFFHRGLLPETERKFEAGIRGNHSRFSMELSYFHNLSRDFVAPAWTGTEFRLDNVASIINHGATLSAQYFGHIYNGSWGITLKWNKSNTVVDELYSMENQIALAGFESVKSVLAHGKPVGAIFGSHYQRDHLNRIIIGSDGFPIKSNASVMIGNPIPDWTMGLSPYLNWREFRVAFVVDVKKGGDVWNGTRALLDYTGNSGATGDLRKNTDYIFEGVDINGDVNTIPVIFFDANQPLEANRWTRYGWDGVAEDYIEDSSWIRLNELQISYSIRRQRDRRAGIREIIFSVGGRNLIVITPYSGVDPSATLFGYGSGHGMDLFNAPSTRSYNAQITFKM